MIHQKMETLSPEEQFLLESASVAGREFVASVLASRSRMDGRRCRVAVRHTCAAGNIYPRRGCARMAWRRPLRAIPFHSRALSRGGISTCPGGPALTPPSPHRRGTRKGIRGLGRCECKSTRAPLPVRRGSPALHPVLSARRRAGVTAQRPSGSGKPVAVRPRTGGAAARNAGTPRGGVRISLDDGSRDAGCKGIRRAGGSPQFSARARTRTTPDACGGNVPTSLSSRRNARTPRRIQAGGGNSGGKTPASRSQG